MCTRKTELALDIKVFLDFHRVYLAKPTNADSGMTSDMYFRVVSFMQGNPSSLDLR